MQNSFAFAFIFLSISLYAQRYTFNSPKSSVSFSIDHLGFLTVTGTFQNFSGEAKFVRDSVIVVSKIQTKTITTKNEDRDRTIQGEQYLNVAVFPVIEIHAKGKQQKDKVTANTLITIRGKKSSWPLILSIKKLSKDKRIVEGTLVLSREKLGLTFGAMNDLIGDEIVVSISTVLELNQS